MSHIAAAGRSVGRFISVSGLWRAQSIGIIRHGSIYIEFSVYLSFLYRLQLPHPLLTVSFTWPRELCHLGRRFRNLIPQRDKMIWPTWPPSPASSSPVFLSGFFGKHFRDHYRGSYSLVGKRITRKCWYWSCPTWIANNSSCRKLSRAVWIILILFDRNLGLSFLLNDYKEQHRHVRRTIGDFAELSPLSFSSYLLQDQSQFPRLLLLNGNQRNPRW